jgi:uncharacterized membrane protein
MKKRLKNLLRVFAILLFMSGFAVSTRGGPPLRIIHQAIQAVTNLAEALPLVAGCSF